MKKKLVSMVLVLAMVCGTLSLPVMATEATAVTYKDLTGWQLYGYTDNGTAGTVESTFKIAEGDGVGYESNHAMYVKWQSTESGSDWTYLANIDLPTYSTTDTYSISFRYKNLSGNDYCPNAVFGWASGKTRLFPGNGLTVSEADGNGWKTVEGSTDSSVEAGSRFLLCVQDANTELYIDDVVVTKNGGTENLVANGDFEATEVEVTAEGGLYFPLESSFSGTDAQKSFTLSNVTGYQSDSSLHLTYQSSTGGNTYALLTPLDASGNKITLTNGNSYTMEFDAKILSDTTIATDAIKGMLTGWGGFWLRGFDPTELEDGWVHYSKTQTCTADNLPSGLMIKTASGLVDVYIDNIKLVCNNDATPTNLISEYASTLEKPWEPSYSAVSAPSVTEELDNWKVAYNGTDYASTVVTSVGEENAYSGDKSLYVEYTAGDYSTTWANISNTGTRAVNLDATKDYTVSFYIKGDKAATTWLTMGYTTSGDGVINRRNVAELTPVKPEDDAKAEAGWRKYVATLSKPTAEVNFQITIQSATKVYIDDFTVAEVDAPETNLVINPGFEGVAPVLPDITRENLPSNWEIYTGQMQSNQYTAAVVTTSENEINKALHLTWTATGSGCVKIWSESLEDKLTVGDEYTLTAKVLRMEGGTGSHLGGWGGWSGQKLTSTIAALGTWTTVTYPKAYTTSSDKRVEIVLEGTGFTELYIDDLVFTDKDGNVIFEEDFETAATGYETSQLKLFDENMNQVSALSSALNGNTLTAAIAITNYDKADLTGQLIIALYDGFELKDVKMSEIINVAADSVETITTQLDMTTYQEGNHIKLFIWDNIDDMSPLRPAIDII